MFLETDAPEKKATFHQKFDLLHAFLGIATFKKHNLSVAATTNYCFENLLNLIVAIINYYNYLIM